MKFFGLVFAGLTRAQAGADFQVVSCNNEITKAPEMTIKVRDQLTLIGPILNKVRSIDPWSS